MAGEGWKPQSPTSQLKLLGGQIAAFLKAGPFVPELLGPALRGSRIVPGQGPGTGPDWQKSVRGGTTRPSAALGPDA